MAPDMQWYCVQTNPRAELVANHNLTSIGYETLFLHYREIIRHARREREKVRPHLPGYLFVQVPARMGFYAITTAHGILRLLDGPEGPARVPAAEIDRMASYGDDNGFMGMIGKAGRRQAEYPEGTPGILSYDGPFTGYPGTVKVDRGKEIVLNVEALGRVVPVSVPPEAFSPGQRSIP